MMKAGAGDSGVQSALKFDIELEKPMVIKAEAGDAGVQSTLKVEIEPKKPTVIKAEAGDSGVQTALKVKIEPEKPTVIKAEAGDAGVQSALKFEIGQRVKLQGLQADASLNGKEGSVETSVQESARYGVRLSGKNGKLLSVKPANMILIKETPIRMIRCVVGQEVCRLRELDLPADLAFRGAEKSPVLSKLGIPIQLQKVLERDGCVVPRQRTASLDNQLACYLMIDPETGLAPPRWEYNIGEVTISRSDGKPVFKKQIEVLWDYFNLMLDMFGDGPEDAHSMMNRDAFKDFLSDRYEGCEIPDFF